MNQIRPIPSLLVEDEIQTRDILASWISEHPSLQLNGIATNGAIALEKLQKGGIELVFLDIDLPVLSGVEILERLEKIPYVIFITVSATHALKAFEMGALDYLHKPFSKERFDKAVQRAVQFIGDKIIDKKEPATRGLVVAEGENHFLVPLQEIIYLSGHDKHTIIHTERHDFETAKLLLHLERRLPRDQFLRIHKQYILNLDYISHVQYLIGGRYQVFLKDSDETDLTVSRKYSTEFKNALSL